MDDDFAGLLLRLVHGHVGFIVVGGVACALNGFVRATEDVDILVDATPANIERLLTVLAEWGEGHARDLSPADFGLEPGAVRLVEAFPLDMFTVLAGRTYAEYLPASQKSEDGVRYLGLDDLIATKRHTYREKDQIDVLALGRIRATHEGTD
jgi:hypothetical protein